jgi:hypothetical protein
MVDSYLLNRKNSGFDLYILHWHLGGERLQVSVIEKLQVTGGNGRSLSGKEAETWAGEERFLLR